MNKTIKRLFTLIEQLSEDEAREVLDFTEFLLSKRQVKKLEPKSNPENDPILDLIGLADSEPFAEKIDEQLYGD